MDVTVSIKTKEEKEKTIKNSVELPDIKVFYGEENLLECMKNILILDMGEP